MTPSSRSRSVRRRLRQTALVVVAVGSSFAMAAPASAAIPTSIPRPPQSIVLPNDAVAGDLGYQPEGIAVRGYTAYVGSLVDGTVVSVNLLTGKSTTLVAADGDPAVGVEVTSDLLLVAGGPSGEMRAYNRRTGALVAVRDIPNAGFINDITVTNGAALFTDSGRAVLYSLPISGLTVGQPTEIPLSGDFSLVTTPGAFNNNGIAALSATRAIVGQSTDPDGTGSALYSVDLTTGAATRVTITGGDVRAADGIIRRGNTIYVVQNDSNSIVELRLDARTTTATYVKTLTDPDINGATTADFGLLGLYAVNAKFGTTGTDAVPYEVVRVSR